MRSYLLRRPHYELAGRLGRESDVPAITHILYCISCFMQRRSSSSQLRRMIHLRMYLPNTTDPDLGNTAIKFLKAHLSIILDPLLTLSDLRSRTSVGYGPS